MTVERGVHQRKKWNGRTGRYPKTIISKHVSWQYLAIVRAIMHHFVLGIKLIKLCEGTTKHGTNTSKKYGFGHLSHLPRPNAPILGFQAACPFSIVIVKLSLPNSRVRLSAACSALIKRRCHFDMHDFSFLVLKPITAPTCSSFSSRFR